MLFKRIKRPKTPLYENVAAQIEALILDGDLKHGDQLPPERELSELFGVSRTCTREAIKALQVKGLVDVRHGRGIFVAQAPTVETDVAQVMAKLLAAEGGDLQDFYEIRKLIEPQAAAWAAERRAAAEAAAILEICRSVSGAGGAEAERPGIIQLWDADTKFHLAIAAATHNDVLRRITYGFLDLLAESRRGTMKMEGRPALSVREHLRIAAAIEAKEPAAARRLMREHLENVECQRAGLAGTTRAGEP